MINEIPIPKSGDPLTALAAPVIAMAKAINGLRQLDVDGGEFHWDEGGAKLRVDGGDGDDDDGTLVFVGSQNGQVVYFVLNGTGPFADAPAGTAPINSP